MTPAETAIVQALAAIAWAVIALTVRGWERRVYRFMAMFILAMAAVERLLGRFS